MRFRLVPCVLILLAVVGSAFAPAQAVEVRAADQATGDQRATPSVPVSVSVFEPVTAGYLTPAFGGATLGILPDEPLFSRPVTSGLTNAGQDFAAMYKAGFRGSQFGVFGGYNSRANLFETAPTTGWNVGASVGYAGFYVRAGVSSDAAETAARLMNDANKGWLAGLGYEMGAFDLRITYMTAQPTGLGLSDHDQQDNRLWMIGGIYQLTPRIRFNADAFTSTRDPRAAALNAVAAPTNAVAPQGTGARVGVQLKF